MGEGTKMTGPGFITKPGIGIKDESQYGGHHRLGETLVIGDRWFRWCKNAAVELGAGDMCVSAASVGDHQNRTLSVAAAIGARTITPTLGSTLATQNQYKDGYACLNKATGFGIAERIKSHPAADSTATLAIELYDGLSIAVDTSTEVTLVKNKYDSVIVMPTGAVPAAPIGVPLRTVTASYYFWLQVKGPAAVLCDTGETLVIGENCAPQDSVEVAGAVGLRDDQTSVNVGRVQYIATAAEYALVDLALA